MQQHIDWQARAKALDLSARAWRNAADVVYSTDHRLGDLEGDYALRIGHLYNEMAGVAEHTADRCRERAFALTDGAA